MTADQPGGRGRLSREELRAELDRAREHMADLEADREHSHERLLDSLAVHLNEGFALMSPSGVQLDVNPAFCAMTGFTREELVGHDNPQPYWPPELHDSHAREVRRLLSTEEPAAHEVTFMRKNGERFPVLVTPSVMRDEQGRPFCLFATVVDITERRVAEAALRRLNRELQAVTDCNQTLMRANDEETLLSEICQIVCDEAGYRLAWVGYAEHDEAKTVRPVAWAGVEAKFLATGDISWGSGRDYSPAGHAIRSGLSVCIQNLAADPHSAPRRVEALRGGLRSCVALPLKDESGQAFGALSIYSTQPDAFTPDEMRLLEGLAGDLAFGITALRARRESKRAEDERREHIRLLESMEQIDQAIRRETDVEQMLQSVVETVLSIFACDRAWLFYPADPDAPTFRVPMEVARPEYPGAGTLNVDVPMHPSLVPDLREALAAGEPLTFTNGTDRPVNALTAEQFGVQAQMFQVIYPRTGKPWVFGMHQCSHARVWTQDEQQRFKEVGRRVADGLGTMLLLRELRASEERLTAAAADWRATFDAMNDSVALFDAGGKIVRCNAATAALTGRGFGDLVGRDCYEVFHGSDGWHQSCPQVKARASMSSETTILEQDGHWLRVTFQPMTNEGIYTGGVHVVSDITELRRAEEALRGSETRFRSLFEDAPIAMWEEDHSAVKVELERLVAAGVKDIAAYLKSHPADYGRCRDLAHVLDANRAAVKLYAATDKRELLARTADLHLPDQPANLCLFWAALLAGKRSLSYEETDRTLTGESIDLLETCTLAPGSEASWERVYVCDADITAFKQAELRAQQGLLQMQSVFDEVIAVIAAIVEARDPYTAGHQQRVSELAAAIAGQLGLSADEVTGIRVGALLHDVGKISVPAEILTKPTALSEVEFDLIKAHPQVTHDLLEGIELPWPVAEMALQHHERLNGSGYPQGLHGEEIIPQARILAVADVVEAIASYRPYRPALGIEVALEEIDTNRGRLYDPLVVDACLALVHEQGFFFAADTTWGR